MQTIAFGLRGIEIGEHDDRICLEYQKQVAKRFNVPPPLCPYKTNKKGIQKLIKKTVIGKGRPLPNIDRHNISSVTVLKTFD